MAAPGSHDAGGAESSTLSSEGCYENTGGNSINASSQESAGGLNTNFAKQEELKPALARRRE